MDRNCAKDVELGASSEGAADEGTGFKSFGRVLEVVYCLVPDFLWDSLYRHDGKAKKGRLIPSLAPSHAQAKCGTFFGIQPKTWSQKISPVILVLFDWPDFHRFPLTKAPAARLPPMLKLRHVELISVASKNWVPRVPSLTLVLSLLSIS
jgi:hypothetical protein